MWYWFTVLLIQFKSYFIDYAEFEIPVKDVTKYFIDYAEFEIPVKDVTNANKVIRN